MQNNLKKQKIGVLKKQIEKNVEKYVLEDWDEIMRDVAEANAPDYDPRY